MLTYSEEEKEFLKHHSYIEDVIDGHHLRYILSGAENEHKMIHSFRMVGELIHEPLMKTSDFECVRGRILLLQPEHDIFSKNDQKTIEELLPDPEVHYIRGSHHGHWVLQDEYISKISSFLGGL